EPPLLSILEQLEELQRELTRPSTALPGRTSKPLGDEAVMPAATPAAKVVAEEMERIGHELDAVRGERDQLHARQQSLALEAAQLRILVGEFEQTQHDAATARLTTFRSLVRVLDEARARWENERKTLQAQAHEREQTLLAEVERRIESEQQRAKTEAGELRQESAKERATLQQALDELTRQHATKSEEYQALGRLRDELERAREEHERHWQERHDALQGELEANKNSQQALQEELERQRREHESAKQQRETLQARLDEHQERQQTQHGEWHGELERSRQERDAAAKQIAVMQSALDEHQRQLQTHREDLAR